MKRNEIVKVKYDLGWFVVQAYIMGLNSFNLKMIDEKLYEMLREVEKYIEQKTAVPYDGDIIKNYVVTEAYKNLFHK